MSDGERAVSEVVGFVFVFSIVILSIVLVSVTGFAGLEQSREAERVNNAERGFDVLADDVDEVARRGAPSRTTELRVNDADISVSERTTITVSVNGSTVYDDTAGALVYDQGTESEVVYVNGAVVRADGAGAVLLREPGFLISTNETVLTLTTFQTVDASGVGGSGSVHVRVSGDHPELLAAETTTGQVTVQVTSPDASVWKRYFEEAEPSTMSCSQAADTVTCTWTTDRVYVTSVDVEVRFD